MKLYCYSLVLFFACLPCNLLWAQQRPADTLALRLDQTRKDSTQVRILLQLARIYSESDLNQAKIYGERAIAVAEEAKDLSGKVQALALVGEIHERLFHFEQALYYYLQSLELIESKKLSKQSFGRLFYRLGCVYQNLRNTEEALKFLREAQASNILDLRKDIHKALAEVHVLQGQSDSALYYYQVAMQETADAQYQAHYLEKMGEVYLQQKNYTAALSYYEQALQIHQKKEKCQRCRRPIQRLGAAVLKDEPT